MRTKTVVGNWKMHTTLADAQILANRIKNGIENLDTIEIILCPPYPWLVPVAEETHLRPKFLSLGAQDVYYQDMGAYTGAVSAYMLHHLVKYAITGHSERRRYFNEDDDEINLKVKSCFKNGIIPILAVGEFKKLATHKTDRRGRPTRLDIKSNVLRQLRIGLEGLTREQASQMIIAYEPIWAIGTGEAVSGIYAESVVMSIRKTLTDLFGFETQEEIRVLYGGSVDSKNVKEFIRQNGIDGVLAGTVSTQAAEFIKLCEEVAEG